MSTKDSKHEQPCTLQSVMCCDSFSHFIPQFEWFTTEYDICLMPYIQSGDLKMRINHCPSCGKYVRDIQITKKELMMFFSQHITQKYESVRSMIYIDSYQLICIKKGVGLSPFFIVQKINRNVYFLLVNKIIYHFKDSNKYLPSQFITVKIINY